MQDNINFPVCSIRLSRSAVDGAESTFFLSNFCSQLHKDTTTSEQATNFGTTQMHEAHAGTLDPVMAQSAQHTGRRA
jgi:hypothetical protein